jgi:hypothetical protein
MSHVSQALVAHASNPTYFGVREQGDHSSKLAQENCSLETFSKNQKPLVVWFEWLSIFPANMKALSSTPVPPKKFPY